jgi:hypothetical protein
MKHVEISPGFIKTYVEACDLQRRELWDREELKSKAAELDHDALERHAEDLATRYTKAMMKNPFLVERMAKEGPQAAMPWNIRKHVPRYQLAKGE